MTAPTPPQLYALLLLPPPPHPPTPPALRAAYTPPLTSALNSLFRSLSSPRSTSSTSTNPGVGKLDIALPCPVNLQRPGSRGCSFPVVQRLLAGVYSLVALICQRNGTASSIDVTVILFDYIGVSSPSEELHFPSPDSLLRPFPPDVPGIHFTLLATSKRPWSTLFIVESEAGLEMYRQFTSLAVPDGLSERVSPAFEWVNHVQRVPGGLHMVVDGGSARRGAADVRAYRNDWAVGDEHHAVAALCVDENAGGDVGFTTRVQLTMAAFLLDSRSSPRRLLVGLPIPDFDDPLAVRGDTPEVSVATPAAAHHALEQFVRGILDFKPPPKNPNSQRSRVMSEYDAASSTTRLTFPDNDLTIIITSATGLRAQLGTGESLSAVVVTRDTRYDAKTWDDIARKENWQMETFETFSVVLGGDEVEDWDSDGDIENARV